MRPKVAAPNVRPGCAKCASLNRLKTSNRKSACWFSVMRKILNSDASVVLNPGPTITPRGSLPDWLLSIFDPIIGFEKQDVLKKSCVVPTFLFDRLLGLQVMFGLKVRD